MVENEILENLSNSKITVLDFHALWCGPCRALTPIIDELIDEYSSDKDIKIIKINVDEHGAIATKFGVRSIPNVVFIKDGEIVNRFNGGKSKDEIKNIIDEVKNLN